jgi:multidrug efflux system membrane fusion protein
VEKEHAMPRRTRILWQAGLGLAVALAAASCGPTEPEPKKTEPPPVTVSQPVSRQIVDYDPYEGHIAPLNNKKSEVRARVRGHLDKLHFREGQMVKEGELLFEIDPRIYKAGLDAAVAQKAAAEAALALAKKEYARTRTLANTGAASREELDVWTGKQGVAAADSQKADAEIERAQLELGFTKVTAPISGKISRPQVAVGDLVNAGGGEMLLATIAPVDPMYVYFDVDERALLRYRRDSRKGNGKEGAQQPALKDLQIPVYVALEGDQGYPHKGVIESADNSVNPGTGTIQVCGELANPAGLLDDGMRARVRIPIGSPHPEILVTERAIGNEQGRKFVYVVDGEDKARRRDVTLGRVEDGLQVVREGLTTKDRVVVNGIQRVRDGMEVKPQEEPMPGAPKPAEQTEKGPKG